jgi:hypothetical protein
VKYIENPAGQIIHSQQRSFSTFKENQAINSFGKSIITIGIKIIAVKRIVYTFGLRLLSTAGKIK